LSVCSPLSPWFTVGTLVVVYERLSLAFG
jgi:hypothetical protein